MRYNDGKFLVNETHISIYVLFWNQFNNHEKQQYQIVNNLNSPECKLTEDENGNWEYYKVFVHFF